MAHAPTAVSLKISTADFTANLLQYEGIQVHLLLRRGMTAKNAIKSLYTEKFHTPLRGKAPVRQLVARLAECLNTEMLTFSVLTAGGQRARVTDTVEQLRRVTDVPTTSS